MFPKHIGGRRRGHDELVLAGRGDHKVPMKPLTYWHYERRQNPALGGPLLLDYPIGWLVLHPPQ